MEDEVTQIKQAVSELIEAIAKAREAQKIVEAAEKQLTEIYRSGQTVLDEWNVVEIDGSHWEVRFNDEAAFSYIQRSRAKHF